MTSVETLGKTCPKPLSEQVVAAHVGYESCIHASKLHQGKSRWHSYLVLVYISINLPFGDCAKYFDHGVIPTKNGILKQIGVTWILEEFPQFELC